ncbi:MAG: sugar ABC transporter permease [Chloroflexi bacterium]|nr:sugar ABC transporter permease [Chloroflexota bacterium]
MATISPEISRKQIGSNKIKKKITPYLYLIPAFLVMAVITFYPMGYQVYMSFTDYTIRYLNPANGAPPFVGLENYARVFAGDVKLSNFNFLRTLGFNLWWTFSNVIIHVSLGILIAVILNIKGVMFKGFYRALYVLPIVLPQIIVAAVFRNMFDPDFGAINQGLILIGRFFNIPEAAFHIRWIDQIPPPVSFIPLTLSYYALLITNVWLGWPFMTIVATGALQSISKDLYEAASIDGANGWQQFWRITLPLLRPAMVPATVYGIIQTFNLYTLIYFLSGGGPLRKTEILLTAAFRIVNEQALYGVAAAFCVVIFFILLILTLLTNQITRATESYDA